MGFLKTSEHRRTRSRLSTTVRAVNSDARHVWRGHRNWTSSTSLWVTGPSGYAPQMQHGDCHATCASCGRLRNFRAVVIGSPLGSSRFRRCRSALRPRTCDINPWSLCSSDLLRTKTLERIVMFGLVINVISESEFSVLFPSAISRTQCCAGSSNLQN